MWRSLVARSVRVGEVIGSIPVTPTTEAASTDDEAVFSLSSGSLLGFMNPRRQSINVVEFTGDLSDRISFFMSN